MRINHNIAALNTYRQLNSASGAQSKSMEKLSSGLAINRAGDNAAGLAISEKMRGQIRGLDQAAKNAQDGISMIQTAEGALNETHDILQRMRELSNQSANGTATDSDRSAMQDELNQLTSEINRVGNTTEFNTQKLLNGGVGSNTGDKLTKATSAQLTGTAITDTGEITVADGAKINVDGKTFDLSGLKGGTDKSAGYDAAKSDVDTKQTAYDSAKATSDSSGDPAEIAATASALNDLNTSKAALAGETNDTTAVESAKDLAKKLGEVTSGGVKLSELVDIKLNDNNELSFTAKSSGATSQITFSGTTTALGVSADATNTGSPTTVERHGVQAGAALGAGNTSNSIAANSSFDITVGSDSAVKVTLKEAKTYDTANEDKNVANAAAQDLVKDLNSALQEAGLSDKVTASLSKDNEVQFISETGKDIKLEGSALASIGFTASGNDISETVKNVNQVVGPGAQGSGFNTKFQIGANTGQSMSLNIQDMRSSALGITGNAGQAGFTKSNSVTNGTNDIKAEAALNISNKEDASKSIAVIDKAIQSVSAERGKLGAVQNRLEHTINNLGTSSENLTAAESRIRDVDYALAA